MKLALVAMLGLAPTVLAAQAKGPDFTGTWRVDAGTRVKNGPREVVIRADSSATWGKETVRWRIKADRISIVIGGEWETYKLKLKGDLLTLSGGDLEKPVSLRKVGPPTPLPAGARIPADPDLGG